MKTITLNEAQEKALERCLKYGEVAVSETERQDGTAAELQKNINEIREQLK